MTKEAFFAAIPRENWQTATTLPYEEQRESVVLTFKDLKGQARIPEPGRDDVIAAFQRVFAAPSDYPQWLELSFARTEAPCVLSLFMNVLGDHLYAQYGCAAEEEDGPGCKSFEKDFPRKAADGLLTTFLTFLADGVMPEGFTQWAPVQCFHIEEKRWKAAADFPSEPDFYGDALLFEGVHGHKQIDAPTSDDVVAAFAEVLNGPEGAHRWLRLSRDYLDTQGGDEGAVFMQLDVLGDGGLCAQYQYVKWGDGGWQARHFEKDFTCAEGDGLLSLFLAYLDEGLLPAPLMKWRPVRAFTIPEAHWESAADFPVQRYVYENDIILEDEDGRRTCAGSDYLSVHGALDWVLAGDGKEPRCLILARDFPENKGDDGGPVFLQLNCSDDAHLSVQYQYAIKEDGLWRAKQFRKVFTRNAEAEVSRYFMAYWESGCLEACLSTWPPLKAFAIAKADWGAATDFRNDPSALKNELLVQSNFWKKQIPNPTEKDLIWAFNWIAKGDPEDHRWLVLSRVFPSAGQGPSYLQAGAFEEDRLYAEYQYVRQEEGRWVAKNFGKDLSLSEAYELLLIFLGYLETGLLPDALTRWRPVVYESTPKWPIGG